MTYDSAMPHPALYRLWLREQVKGIGTGLQASETEILVGVSVARENTFTHNPFAENLTNGLSGICAGLEHRGQPHSVNGVAIYAAWDADEEDWQAWEDWLN